MAADINHIMIIGRLTRDADLKYTSGGFAISNFSIAVNRRRKNGDQWIEEANFFEINLYGKSAESLKPYLVKGKQVAVDGELRQDRWEQDNVQLLGGNAGGSGSSPAGGYNQSNRGTYQPRMQEPSGSSGAYDSYEPSPYGGGNDSFPEDIPF